MDAITDLGKREQEARRIARDEGYPINYSSDDWTFFSLADDLPTNHGVWRTCFTWNEFRFEGFMSDVSAAR